MAVLSREEILSGRSLKHEDVEVPELGGSVRVYELAPRQRMDFVRWMKARGVDEGLEAVDALAIADVRERLVAMSLRDEAGALLFSEDDVPALGAMLSEEVLQRLAERARYMSGMGDAAIEERADDLPNSPGASPS